MTQNPPKKEKNLSDWEAPVIFKTSDFFGPTSTEKQSAGEDTRETTKETETTNSDDQTDDNSSQTTVR